jgi:hypothetical protein
MPGRLHLTPPTYRDLPAIVELHALTWALDHIEERDLIEHRIATLTAQVDANETTRRATLGELLRERPSRPA